MSSKEDNMLSKKLLPPTMECALCTKFGNYLCERCGETYCSKYCQMSDWREHRRVCMPVPRLLQRTDGPVYPAAAGRMLMDAGVSFDATDAIGSVSEHSAVSDTPNLTKEQLVKLTSSLSQMQLERQNPNIVMKSTLSEIEEVQTAATTTPQKSDAVAQEQLSNGKSEVKGVETPKQRMVLTPPPKKQQIFLPSVRAIRSQMHVTIVHVEDHNTVFVVPSEEFQTWSELIKEVNEYAGAAANLKRPPEVGYIILAKPKTCDSFSRGLVTKIRAKDEMAKIEFIEYGFTDIVKFSEMKCLPEKLVNACRLVNKVKLSGVPDIVENAPEIKRLLTELQENRTNLMVKNLDPIEKTAVSAHFSGSLVDTEKFVLINDHFKNLTEAEPAVEMKEPTTQKTKQEIEMTGFSGTDLELCILDNSFLSIGCFSAVRAKDMALLGKNDHFLNENAASIEKGAGFHPRNGEDCLAKSVADDRWYRANTQNKIDDNTYNLMYIDYGNMEKVSVDRIREMRAEFTFPCVTAMCFIDGLGDSISPQAEKRLAELIVPMTKKTFDEVQYNGEETNCKSNEIINILKSERLI